MHTLSIAAASISAKILMTFNDVKRETEYNSNMATLKVSENFINLLA